MMNVSGSSKEVLPLDTGETVTVDFSQLLGRGGSASVYGASLNGRRVALKMFDRDLRRVDLSAKQRFLREVALFRTINSRKVLEVLGASPSTDEDRLYYVMPLAEKTLRGFLTAVRRPVPRDRTDAIFFQLAEGLAAIHSAHVVHRDIKPENIVIIDGEFRISDLGIARPLYQATQLTTPGNEPRSLFYHAPEQHEPSLGPIGYQTDICAMGYVFNEILTGTLSTRPDAPKPSSVSREYQEYDDVIAMMTRFHPADRIQSADRLNALLVSARDIHLARRGGSTAPEATDLLVAHWGEELAPWLQIASRHPPQRGSRRVRTNSRAFLVLCELGNLNPPLVERLVAGHLYSILPFLPGNVWRVSRQGRAIARELRHRHPDLYRRCIKTKVEW